MQILKLNKTQFVRVLISMTWASHWIWHPTEYGIPLNMGQHPTEYGTIKKASEILAIEKNLHEKVVNVLYYRSRESQFLQYFRSDSNFLYCHNIQGLLEELRIPIDNSTEWRVFIDRSKQCLKCVLVHKGNTYGAIPNGHSDCIREE